MNPYTIKNISEADWTLKFMTTKVKDKDGKTETEKPMKPNLTIPAGGEYPLSMADYSIYDWPYIRASERGGKIKLFKPVANKKRERPPTFKDKK